MPLSRGGTVLESITFLLIKEKIKLLWRTVKKYWQFFLGLSVGVFVFFLTRDGSRTKRALREFRESSIEERERSLEISREESEKVKEAIEKLEDDLLNASEDLENRNSDISDKQREIRDALLEEEASERGTIARELQDEIDNI